jgi:enoyl-CoA hydratase/carnithine racemase
MWRQLEEVALRLADDNRIKVVALRGAGRQFSTGYDLADLDGLDLDEAQAGLDQMERALIAIESIPVPVIAVIRGSALGGGLALALACDLRVADDTVRLGMPVAGLGIAISESFAHRLVQAFGLGKTNQLLFLGEPIRSTEALAMGAIQRVTDRAGLDGVVEAWEEQIIAMPKKSLQATKRVLSGMGRESTTEAPEILGQWALNTIQDRFPSHS